MLLEAEPRLAILYGWRDRDLVYAITGAGIQQKSVPSRACAADATEERRWRRVERSLAVEVKVEVVERRGEEEERGSRAAALRAPAAAAAVFLAVAGCTPAPRDREKSSIVWKGFCCCVDDEEKRKWLGVGPSTEKREGSATGFALLTFPFFPFPDLGRLPPARRPFPSSKPRRRHAISRTVSALRRCRGPERPQPARRR